MLALAAGAGALALYARFDELDAFRKAKSETAARSCVQMFAVKSYDDSYAGDESVEDLHCSIGPIQTSGAERTAVVSAEYENARTMLSAVARDGSILSEEEIPTSPP
jgi:hypothetical protein